ncbi:MAG TPA: hemolysin family protein [Terriglobia bacterium]|nr:hemolysin family protein [Terriglobia bacterium]
MTMILWTLVLGLLVAASSVASYLRLLMRRLTPMGARTLFQTNDPRRIRADRERVGVSISALHGVAMALYSIGVTTLFIFRHSGALWENLGASLLLVMATLMIFDQLIPFILVARHDEPEAILRQWLPMLRAAVYLALPVTFPILISTTIGRLLESPEEETAPPEPQRGLKELIESGEEAGLIEKGERELLQSVVEFGEKVVREVMTPRPEIAAVEIDVPIEELRSLFRQKRYTRYPVYSKVLDQTEGVVSVRDLMELSPDDQKHATLRTLMKPVRFVPETKPIRDLLKELQKTTIQLAIAIDEYGSVSGLVTVEDLVEELVGEIRDEVEPHERDIIKESANTFLVAGQTELAQLADQLNVEVESGDYSTVSGLVLAKLGHMPAVHEKVEANGATFEILEVNRRTVLKVRLVLAASTSETQTTHAGTPKTI